MGCAVKIHKRNEKRGSWAFNSIDGWYLRTSPEHYQCHVIYVKKTRSERISDMVHFKHKYITQPLLTPEDTIVKALNNLTNALKQKRNKKGIVEYEALQRIDKILNNIPVTEQQVPPTKTKQVTFDKMAKPPREILTPNKVTNNQHPTPKVPNKVPTPRVKSPLPIITKARINKPIPNDPIKSKTHKMREEPSFEQTRLKQRINESKNSRAQITHQTHMQLQQQKYSERAQLICANKTGQFNYQQLIRDPKHKEIWSTSAANEFGRLTQGVE
jgi:hypothetical protein